MTQLNFIMTSHTYFGAGNLLQKKLRFKYHEHTKKCNEKSFYLRNATQRELAVD
jgi:hypothetical protein